MNSLFFFSSKIKQINFKEICPFLLAAHILESFETHHPLVLPEGGYQFQLGRDVKDPGLVAELDEMNEFIATLSRSQSKQTAASGKQKVKKRGVEYTILRAEQTNKSEA